jgi:hypothetical protein
MADREAMASPPRQETKMARFGLKSALPLTLVLGFAFAVPAVTMAQAQGSRDPATQRNLNDQQDPNKSRLNDPANARNLNDTQDPKNSRLNDPSNARNVTDPANEKENKRDTK